MTKEINFSRSSGTFDPKRGTIWSILIKDVTIRTSCLIEVILECFPSNVKISVVPNSCKNKQCIQESSENLIMREMKSHSFMLETRRVHTLGDNENGARNQIITRTTRNH